MVTRAIQAENYPRLLVVICLRGFGRGQKGVLQAGRPRRELVGLGADWRNTGRPGLCLFQLAS